MTSHMDVEEWFPVVRLSDERHFPAEPADFTEDEIARINAAFKEFGEIQRLMHARFKLRGKWDYC